MLNLPLYGRPFWVVVSLWMISGCAKTPELSTVSEIPELMDAFKVDGLALVAVSGNEVLVSRGFGVSADGSTFTSRSSCGLYSATKTLAALTYTKLAQDERFDLAAPLGDYLDDAPAIWADIPFFRLLNHTSGISMVVNRPEFQTLSQDPQARNQHIYDIVKAELLDYAPGAHSRYRQSGYAIGEMILRQEFGVDFDALLEQHVLQPAGMRATYHPATADTATPPILMSAGGYQTTAEDIGRLFLGLNRDDVIDIDYLKTLMLDEQHLFDNYSLGVIAERTDGVLTLGHSGGGARANIRYAPDQKIGVMICTDDPENRGLAIVLARRLITEITTGEKPPTPLLVALSDYESMSGDAVVAAYRLAAQQSSVYDLSDSESLLNGIGYAFISQNRPKDAVDVLSLNTELYPESPNTYDSLGEAYLALGDYAAALTNYEYVLKLDPGNDNASAMIDKISKTTEP